MSVEIPLNVSVPLEALATDIANSGVSHDDLLTFMVNLDEEIADYHFTVALRDKLNEAIKLEDRES